MIVRHELWITLRIPVTDHQECDSQDIVSGYWVIWHILCFWVKINLYLRLLPMSDGSGKLSLRTGKKNLNQSKLIWFLIVKVFKNLNGSKWNCCNAARNLLKWGLHLSDSSSWRILHPWLHDTHDTDEGRSEKSHCQVSDDWQSRVESHWSY